MAAWVCSKMVCVCVSMAFPISPPQKSSLALSLLQMYQVGLGPVAHLSLSQNQHSLCDKQPASEETAPTETHAACQCGPGLASAQREISLSHTSAAVC